MDNNPTLKELLVFAAIVIVIILGVKMLWAKAIHGNVKCAFTQCRIITN